MHRGRGQEVVRLVARALRGREPYRAHEFREHVELLEQLRVENPAALVGVERLVAVGRLADGVPSDEHGTRLLGLPEPQQHVREPEDAAQAHALRHRMIGAVGERIPVDHEQRPHSSARSSSIRVISRSVASSAACL